MLQLKNTCIEYKSFENEKLCMQSLQKPCNILRDGLNFETIHIFIILASVKRIFPKQSLDGWMDGWK